MNTLVKKLLNDLWPGLFFGLAAAFVYYWLLGRGFGLRVHREVSLDLLAVALAASLCPLALALLIHKEMWLTRLCRAASAYAFRVGWMATSILGGVYLYIAGWNAFFKGPASRAASGWYLPLGLCLGFYALCYFLYDTAENHSESVDWKKRVAVFALFVAAAGYWLRRYF